MIRLLRPMRTLCCFAFLMTLVMGAAERGGATEVTKDSAEDSTVFPIKHIEFDETIIEVDGEEVTINWIEDVWSTERAHEYYEQTFETHPSLPVLHRFLDMCQYYKIDIHFQGKFIVSEDKKRFVVKADATKSANKAATNLRVGLLDQILSLRVDSWKHFKNNNILFRDDGDNDAVIAWLTNLCDVICQIPRHMFIYPKVYTRLLLSINHIDDFVSRNGQKALGSYKHHDENSTISLQYDPTSRRVSFMHEYMHYMEWTVAGSRQQMAKSRRDYVNMYKSQDDFVEPLLSPKIGKYFKNATRGDGKKYQTRVPGVKKTMDEEENDHLSNFVSRRAMWGIGEEIAEVLQAMSENKEFNQEFTIEGREEFEEPKSKPQNWLRHTKLKYEPFRVVRKNSDEQKVTTDVILYRHKFTHVNDRISFFKDSIVKPIVMAFMEKIKDFAAKRGYSIPTYGKEEAFCNGCTWASLVGGCCEIEGCAHEKHCREKLKGKGRIAEAEKYWRIGGHLPKNRYKPGTGGCYDNIVSNTVKLRRGHRTTSNASLREALEDAKYTLHNIFVDMDESEDSGESLSSSKSRRSRSEGRRIGTKPGRRLMQCQNVSKLTKEALRLARLMDEA